MNPNKTFTPLSLNIEDVPPHNDEAEKRVLGYCLTPLNGRLCELAKILKPEDFYHSNHQEIFRAVLELYEKGLEIEPVAVCDVWGRKEEIGYLYDLVDNAANLGISPDYQAEMIKRDSQKRQIRNACLTGLFNLSEGKELEEITAQIEESLGAVNQAANQENEITLGELAGKTLDTFNNILDGKQVYDGIKSGVGELDEFTGGFRPKNLIVFAARPSMGKSSLLFQIGIDCGKRGLPALIFSAEMSREEFGEFALCNEGGINLQRIKKSCTNGEGREQEKAALGAVNRLFLDNVLIVDKPNIKLSEIKLRARQWGRKNPGGLIIIDHLGIIDLPKKESRYIEVGDISKELKQLSRELDLPVLLACQLSRKVEERENRRPMLSDLRDSGEIEQNADVVLGIYREAAYNPGAGEAAELLIMKNRCGDRNRTIPLRFIAEYRRFESLPPAWGRKAA